MAAAGVAAGAMAGATGAGAMAAAAAGAAMAAVGAAAVAAVSSDRRTSACCGNICDYITGIFLFVSPPLEVKLGHANALPRRVEALCRWGGRGTGSGRERESERAGGLAATRAGARARAPHAPSRNLIPISLMELPDVSRLASA